MNKIKQAFHSLVDRKLNIISFCSGKDFITSISKCGHNFFLINDSGSNIKMQERKNLPENIHIMNNLNVSYRWNLCVILSRQPQVLQYAHSIRNTIGIPILLFENKPMRYYFPQIPHNQNIPKRLIAKIQQIKPDVEVFLNEEIQNSWSSESTSYTLDDKQDSAKFWNNIFQQIGEN